MKDIFEDLNGIGGGAFLSDLRYGVNPSLVQKAVSNLKFEDYELSQLSELAKYIFSEDVRFGSATEARTYFDNKK